MIAGGLLDAGAAFRASHRPIVDEMFKAARAEGRREPYEAYAFDAFMELVRRAASAGRPADDAAEDRRRAATTSRPWPPRAPSRTPRKLRRRPRAAARHVGIIRIDHSALRRGSVEGDEVCEIVGLGPIPVSVARELLGDAVLKLVITKGIDVDERHPSRPVRDGGPTGRFVVAVGGVHGVGLSPARNGSRTTTATSGSKRNAHASTSSTRSASTTTTSRPATTGRSSKAKARGRWSHPTTPATRRTDRHRDGMRRCRDRFDA